MNATAIRREGRTFYVPSRTRGGLEHRIDWAMDGALLCNCESTRRRDNECWAVKAVREEIEMTGLAESTALVPVRVTESAALVPSEHEISAIKTAAAMAFAGKIALPEELNTEAKVTAVMMYGWELGLKPMTAVRHLYIVKGKVQPSCEVMAGLVMARYPDARLYVDSIDDNHCTMRLVWPSRRVNAPYTVTWKDIERAGLAQSGTNKQYPQDRMRYHATKRLLRIYAPDVINGLDQGAPIIADQGEAADSGASDDDWYNDGDEEYIDGQLVNRETGEITSTHEATQGQGAEPARAGATAESPSNSSQPEATNPAPATSPDPNMPRLWQAYVAEVLDALAKQGYDRDTVTASSQENYSNKEPKQLTPPELVELAASFGVNVPLPGQPRLVG